MVINLYAMGYLFGTLIENYNGMIINLKTSCF